MHDKTPLLLRDLTSDALEHHIQAHQAPCVLLLQTTRSDALSVQAVAFPPSRLNTLEAICSCPRSLKKSCWPWRWAVLPVLDSLTVHLKEIQFVVIWEQAGLPSTSANRLDKFLAGTSCACRAVLKRSSKHCAAFCMSSMLLPSYQTAQPFFQPAGSRHVCSFIMLLGARVFMPLLQQQLNFKQTICLPAGRAAGCNQERD